MDSGCIDDALATAKTVEELGIDVPDDSISKAENSPAV